MLAWALGNAEDELRADMQQFYGLNLDEIGVSYSVSHAACLAAQLPRESRVNKKLEPECKWDDMTRLIHSIELTNRQLVWMQTKDGQKNRRQPQPLEPPWKTHVEDADTMERNQRAVAAALGIGEA